MSLLPKVAIDGRMVGPIPHGFARYVSALAEGLALMSAEAPLPYEPVFLVPHGESPKAFAGFAVCEIGASFLNPLEWVEIPIVLKRLGAALYHSPTFASLPWVPCPWVVTVHDLNHLQFGGWKEKFYYERLLRPFVQKARAVATVSEFSRKEIAQWAARSTDSIEVVYNAIDPAFRERANSQETDAVLDKYGLKKKGYFFCLSNSKPHKNVPALLEAYAGYRAEKLDHWELALNFNPGEPGFSDAQGIKLLGRPSDEEARALMAGAGAVVFPSLYEGFGLPPMEAACLGVPLIVSRIPPHREALADLVQGEVMWVEPKDVAAWTKALVRTTGGAVLGASMESRSQLMRRFSAVKMGAHMDRIYRRVLKLES